MVGIVFLLLIVGFSGCEESVDDTSKFIGKWTLVDSSWTFDMSQYLNNTYNYSDFNDETWIFYLNGTAKLHFISYYPNNTVAFTSTNWSTWEVKDGSLFVTYSNNDTSEVNYEFSKEYTQLHLFHSGYMTSIYTKSNDVR